MTASSSYSGTVDNFWSRDDIRVHTFGGSPEAVQVTSLRDLFEGKPTRTATLIGRHSSIRLQPAHHRTLAEQRFDLEPCDGASGADLGRHLVRSGLGNRRVGSQGPPCADEVPLAARQPMPPTDLNGSASQCRRRELPRIVV